jgi:D-arabinonate dehydratase
MKITDVRAIPIRVPQRMKYDPPATGFRTESDSHVLIKVETDESLTGIGEAWRLTPRAVATFIDEALKPRLLGEDPRQIEMLWRKLYFGTFRYGRKGMVLNAISGIEIALWDVVGKYRELPVYEMLGGACWDHIRAYASLPPYARSVDAAADAVALAEEGYHLIKLHQRDLDSIEATRNAIGPNVELAVDVNGAWTPWQATDAARSMEPYNVRWLEEPIYPMDDYESLAWIRHRSDVSIAAGENEYTHFGFKQLIASGAADLLQPDVVKAGGLLICRKILALAEAWNLSLIPHSFYYGPAVAATAHFVLANPLSNEMEINTTPIETSFMQPTYRPVNGILSVPEAPGLGIELDETCLEQNQMAC